MGKDELISVGRIISFHGVKGEVKIFPLTDNPNRFSDLQRVFITEDNTNIFYTAHIQKTFWHKNNVIVKFKEYNSKDEIESLKDYFVKIPKDERPELDEGEYYYDQIIGLLVYDIESNYLGQITDIKETGSNDVYIVSDGEREVLLPAIKHVVKEIDLNNNIVKVELMEGLID